jgi:hypothetical protein
MGVHRLGRESPIIRRIIDLVLVLSKGYPVNTTVAMAKPKKTTLIAIVSLKRVFSTPRLAENTAPVSVPPKPPNPAPLLCKMTLKIKEIDVIIIAISKYLSTKASEKYCC